MTVTSTRTYLLWQDTDRKRAPADRIAWGAQAYFEKYGVRPTVCIVNPLWVGVAVDGIEVRVEHYVRPDCMWLGVE